MVERTWKARMGRVFRRRNIGRRPTEAEFYNGVRVQFSDGEERCPLFTDHEFRRALTREKKQPEDVIRPARLLDVLD